MDREDSALLARGFDGERWPHAFHVAAPILYDEIIHLLNAIYLLLSVMAMKFWVFAIALLSSAPASSQSISCTAGMAGAYPCQNVDLLAHLPFYTPPTYDQGSSDIWGWTDPVHGIEYAIITQYDHTAFVDLSDPRDPVVVGTLAAPGQSIARDAKVYADHAFLSTDNGEAGVQVFDLTRLRDVTDPPVAFEADTYYSGMISPHNFAVDEASGFGYFVLVDGTTGIQMLDIRDPLNPIFAGSFAELGNVHDLQCLTYDGPDLNYTGREICFASSLTRHALGIVDVTDKQAPALIGEAPYPLASYPHQGWLTDDGRHFLLDDESDEFEWGFNTRTIVFDVADLDDPEFAFEYYGTTTATDHNLFVHDGYVFQANYSSGLRILDLAEIDLGTLTEVAFFDSHPETNAIGQIGAFGVYPFFESGIVALSDTRRGLFVLQPRLVTTSTPDEAAKKRTTLDVYPNPFSDHATLSFSIAERQYVTITVYDMMGREVALIHRGPLGPGEKHVFQPQTTNMSAGSYTFRVTGEDFVLSRQVTIVR